jgi:hypothetical protein
VWYTVSNPERVLLTGGSPAGLFVGASQGKTAWPWRQEQPGAVMASGPVVASRCQRLASRARHFLMAQGHFLMAQGHFLMAQVRKLPS